jgi:cobalt-zinc-cadmium efflux system protein
MSMLSVEKCNCADSDKPQKTQLLLITVGLLAIFFITEWSVGLWTHSLSLQADAQHILSDVAALGISLIATWLARKPATGKATFGHQRVEIFAALINGLSLLAIAFVIFWEAIHRWQNPETILALPMLAVAFIGLVINILNINILHSHSHNDLNIRGVFLHILADTASSVGVIIAALSVHFLNWLWADTIISLLVATLTAISAIPLVKISILVLLEYAPDTINPEEVEKSLKSFPGVTEVEKLHIWAINSHQVILSARVKVDSDSTEEREKLLYRLQIHLQQNFGIHDTFLQLNHSKLTQENTLHPLFQQDLVAILSSRAP